MKLAIHHPRAVGMSVPPGQLWVYTLWQWKLDVGCRDWGHTGTKVHQRRIQQHTHGAAQGITPNNHSSFCTTSVLTPDDRHIDETCRREHLQKVKIFNTVLHSLASERQTVCCNATFGLLRIDELITGKKTVFLDVTPCDSHKNWRF
jgi:hypothetical protein